MSVVFHLLVAFSFSIAWPFIASPPTTAQPLVIVNMVDRVPETNLEAAKSKAPKASDVEQEATKASTTTTPPPPPPPPKPAPKAKPPEKPVKAPVPDAEILPDKQVKPPKAKPVSARGSSCATQTGRAAKTAATTAAHSFNRCAACPSEQADQKITAETEGAGTFRRASEPCGCVKNQKS